MPLLRSIFDPASQQARLEALQAEANKEDFWQRDAQEQAKVLRETRSMQVLLTKWATCIALIEDLEAGLSLVEEEVDPDLHAEMQAISARLEAALHALKIRNMLSEEHDECSAIILIHSGAGGTESLDWAAMLMRMYQRWTEEQGLKMKLLDLQPGEETGVKSVTFQVEGNYAFGRLKVENGVHRLVRISPFDTNKRRHTSFASVFVHPDVEDDIQIDILDSELRIDTFRAQGAGGQHINTTDSAIRITHLPTGIVVQCQGERSQHKNRAAAMKVLKAKLYQHRKQELDAEKEKRNASKQQIAWGSQIRSYVLHPYQMVKDHRTGLEIGNAIGVLDGNLTPLIEQALLQKVWG